MVTMVGMDEIQITSAWERSGDQVEGEHENMSWCELLLTWMSIVHYPVYTREDAMWKADTLTE